MELEKNMEKELEGQVALVTGASRGIGQGDCPETGREGRQSLYQLPRLRGRSPAGSGENPGSRGSGGGNWL